VARAKTGLADVYQDKNIYDKAINLYEESREVFQAELRYFQFRERIHSNRTALAAMLQATRMNLGHCLRSLGEAYFQGPEPNFAEAREKLEESLRLRREIGGNIFIADSEIALCELALAERRYSDALILSTSAANLTAPGSEGDNPDIRWQALLAQGQSLLDLGRLNDAAAPLKMAIQVVESLKDPDLGTGEKPSFFNSITWFFRQKVAPYIAMAELCVRQDRPVEALRYAELAKARTLLLGRPMAAVTREDSLGSTTVSSEELAHVLSTSVPDDKTAALEYMFGADCGYAFLVTRAKADDQPTVKVATFATEKPPGGFTGDDSVPRSIANLDSAIEVFRSKIEKSYTAYPRALANSLYEELVKRFEKDLATKERLIVVPTGMLWRIPFEALSTSKNANLTYLIENFAISYVPSLSFLTQIIDRSKGEHQSISSNSLVLTDPVTSERQLTSISSSATSLASVFSNQPHFFHGKSFAGIEATRQHFLREAPANKLILIATHAVVGGNNPVESYFAVTPEPGVDPNGRLTAADIMTEQLSANLVVLSGCETELGRYVEGEGEVGSGWAFLYSGCASTLVCQWRVDRDATLKLTAGFCHALDQRLLSSSAEVSLAGLLRSTRLAILADERYSHPFFWAGMVLVGDSFWRSPATSVGER
jgi:CHAT domain-containing protein